MGNMESGVRPSFGNAVGPQSLGSQIPSSQGNVSTMGDLFASQKPSPIQAPAQRMAPSPQATPQPAQVEQTLPNGEKTIEAKKQDDDDSLNKAIANLSGKLPGQQKKELDRINDEDLGRQLKGIAGKIGNHPAPLSAFSDNATIQNNPSTDAFTKLKQMFALSMGNNAANAGNGSFEQTKSAFESIYGPNGVQVKNNKLYVDPDGSGKFQRVDQKMLGPVSDFVLNHLSKIPGFMANVGTQAAVDAAGAPADVASGGTTALPIAAAGAAAGGVAQSGTDQLVRSGMNAMSPYPQAEQKTDTVSSLASESLKSAGFNLAGWGLLKGASSAMTSQTGLKAINSLKDLVHPEFSSAIDAATSNAQQASIRLELERLTNSMQGLTRTSGGTGAGIEAQIGRQTGSAIDGVTDNLMSTLDAVKDKAIEISGKSGKNVDPTNLMGQMEKTFSKYGINIVSDTDAAGLSKAKSGFAEMPEDGTRFALESPNANSVLGGLVKDYNYLKGVAISNDGQIPPSTFYSVIGKYQNLSKFDKNAGAFPQEQELFRTLQHSALTDRQSFENSVFQGSGLPEEKLAADAYSRASSHLDNISQLDGLLKNDETRQLLVPAILNAAPAKRLAQLNSIKNVLGEGSEGWGQLRGEVINKMINDGVDASTGYLDGKSILNSMKSMGPQVTDVLMSKGEQGSLRQLALQANKISNMTDAPSGPEKGAMMKMVSTIGSFTGKAGDFAESLFRATNNNKVAIDYLINDGLVDAARNASSKVEQTKILETIRFMDEIAGGAKQAMLKRAGISNIPTYLMMAPTTAAAGNVIHGASNLLNPPRPAPSQQSQVPMQPELSMGQ